MGRYATSSYERKYVSDALLKLIALPCPSGGRQ